MSKGLRSNRKKALRTLRRNDVKSSSKYVEDETRRISSLHRTAEAGKQARELVKEGSAPQPVEIDDNRPMPALQAMDIDDATANSAKRSHSRGIPVTQKKRLKIQRKKKVDGLNALHKKKKKGKRK